MSTFYKVVDLLARFIFLGWGMYYGLFANEVSNKNLALLLCGIMVYSISADMRIEWARGEIAKLKEPKQ